MQSSATEHAPDFATWLTSMWWKNALRHLSNGLFIGGSPAQGPPRSRTYTAQGPPRSRTYTAHPPSALTNIHRLSPLRGHEDVPPIPPPRTGRYSAHPLGEQKDAPPQPLFSEILLRRPVRRMACCREPTKNKNHAVAIQPKKQIMLGKTLLGGSGYKPNSVRWS